MAEQVDGRLRVLIVEDSQDDADLLLLELRACGYAPAHERVEDAGAMRAALLATPAEGPWDAVLCDHNMPRFDAPSALEVVREHDPDLPFLVVSRCVGDSLVASLMKSGATDYVDKDELSRLPLAVDRALREVTLRKERRKAEEALRESEERLALAAEGSRDGLWEWNRVTNRYYYSPRFLELFELTEADRDMPMKDVWLRVVDEDQAGMRQAFMDHVYKRTPYDVEFRFCTKEGEIRWLSSRGQARWDEAGRILRVAGSVSDITARKRAEEELREQLALVQAQQAAIRDLSTPIIEVWDGVLTLPVFGVLDAERAAVMMEALLAAVVERACRYVILDVTGVAGLDAPSAHQVLKIIRAVELLGARGIVVGIRPAVAQAIVAAGLDLSGLTTLSTLRSALLHCMRAGTKR